MAYVWAVLFALVLLAEGYALGTPQTGDTLSALVRAAVRHPYGRVVCYPLWAWLTWHWFMSPAEGPTWRDAVAVLVGLAVAAWTSWR